ncbi:hypothetical protein B1no1_08840 [Thermolongibacillus altinsuensis]|nr:hypothetical protein B1no1_08840 [Thermolongibacillus altinsuensis]
MNAVTDHIYSGSACINTAKDRKIDTKTKDWMLYMYAANRSLLVSTTSIEVRISSTARALTTLVPDMILSPSDQILTM